MSDTPVPTQLVSGEPYDSSVDYSLYPRHTVMLVGIDSGARRVFAAIPPGASLPRNIAKFPGKHFYVIRGDPANPSPLQGIAITSRNINYWPYFLGYDWSLSNEPVNQIPYLEGQYAADYTHTYDDGTPYRGPYIPGYFEHVCKFAHELASLPSHTYQHLDHNKLSLLPDEPHDDDSNLRWSLLWKYARAVIGYNYNEVLRWSELDPTDATSNWSNLRANIQTRMGWLCWLCPHPFWARKLLTEMDTAAMQSAMTPTSRIRAAGTRYEHTVYTVKLPQLASETLLPKTGPLDFFASTVVSYNSDGPWKGWTEGYRKALKRFDEKYAR